MGVRTNKFYGMTAKGRLDASSGSGKTIVFMNQDFFTRQRLQILQERLREFGGITKHARGLGLAWAGLW